MTTVHMAGKRRNLLKNPRAKAGLADWEVTANGGQGFLVEKGVRVKGCKRTPTSDELSCWATSYGRCEKKQLVNLRNCGISPRVMDNTRPEIKISEWYGARDDAGIEYWLKVRLLDGNKQELARKQFTDSKSACGDWFQFTDSFTNYPDGARFVEYTHGGTDNCNWAGHYGAKITCSSLTVDV